MGIRRKACWRNKGQGSCFRFGAHLVSAVNRVLRGTLLLCNERAEMNKKVAKVETPQPPVDLSKICREISAMAWIENEFGELLMVRQVAGNRLWTLPGGKVRPKEEVAAALSREVLEEVGLRVARARIAGIYDRVERQNITILFRVQLEWGDLKIKRPQEIEQVAFHSRLPARSSPSAKYFWKMRRELL